MCGAAHLRFAYFTVLPSLRVPGSGPPTPADTKSEDNQQHIKQGSIHAIYTRFPVYFKPSLEDLEYLIQWKYYVNSCSSVLFRDYDKKKKRLNMLRMDMIFFPIRSVWG